jgi:hypothetical protein
MSSSRIGTIGSPRDGRPEIFLKFTVNVRLTADPPIWVIRAPKNSQYAGHLSLNAELGIQSKTENRMGTALELSQVKV